MARKTLTNVNAVQLADQAVALPQPNTAPTANLYSGNIMRMKPETGYVMLMVRNVNGVEVNEEVTALFLEQDAELLSELNCKVGDAIAFAATSLAESDLGPLPRDNRRVLKAIGYVSGTLSMVRRKPVAVELVAKADGSVASPGMAKRLLELGLSLGSKLGLR